MLVLGVRRRQSLLGGANAPSLLHLLRLSPGETRSIVEPMEKALLIYQESGNAHQAAAVNYQMAMFYSKVWTCQRDETKTRENLSAAFKHYDAAMGYFSVAIRGNEKTFVVLCIDFADLLSTVSGEQCLCQAFLRYLDTMDAFSKDSIDRGSSSAEWMAEMCTLAGSVEDKVFKTLRNLVKLAEDSKDDKPGKFKNVYRAALGAKMANAKRCAEEGTSKEEKSILDVHSMLKATRESYYAK